MKIANLFNVFSRRTNSQASIAKKITDTFRNRVLIMCRDTFDSMNYLEKFWKEIHKKFQYLLGKVKLTEIYFDNPVKEIIHFLLNCEDKHFFDFIEYIFQLDFYWQVVRYGNEIVDEFNNFFHIDDLPFALTEFIWETKEEPIGEGFKETRAVKILSEYPKVIRRDNEVTYKYNIEPVLTLLREREFSSANKEFLEALEDFRKEDYGDCLIKCGSSFESTMKLICNKNGWKYSIDDQAAKLIKTVIEHTGLNSFFVEPLIIVATIRNKLSKAHGSGTEKRIVPEYIAEFAINATASAILLLIKASKC